MEQDSFPGYEDHKEIRLIESGGIKTVVVNGQEYMSWQSWDTASQRMAIVQLYQGKFATQEDLSRMFNLNINSVQKYVTDFTKDGIQGLAGQRSGPRESWKLTSRLRSKILLLALREGIIGYEAIQKRLEAWNERVSISSIRQVLLENGLVNERLDARSREVNQVGFFDTRDKEQLHFAFTHISEPFDENEVVVEVEDGKVEEEEEVNNFSVVDIKALSYYSQAQRRYLDQLEQGCHNTYVGGLLFAPLLEHYSYLPMLKRVIDIPTYEGYSLEELCLTLFYFDVFGFRSMEDFKRVYIPLYGRF
jgi:transposase